MVGEGIPQSRRSHLEGPISHSAEFGLGDLELVAIRGTEMSGWVLPIDEVLEVHWCAAVGTLIGQETYLILNPEPNRKPVKFMEDGCDVLRFTHPHQNPGSAVLNVLQSLQAPARDPDEECIAVVEPGGDKGMNQLL